MPIQRRGSKREVIGEWAAWARTETELLNDRNIAVNFEKFPGKFQFCNFPTNFLALL
jgi:hypothetical protein